MKTIYLIGGTMGVGKTTVSQQLKKKLPNSVFLDGDWCWDADPFQVTRTVFFLTAIGVGMPIRFR